MEAEEDPNLGRFSTVDYYVRCLTPKLGACWPIRRAYDGLHLELVSLEAASDIALAS